VKTFELLNRARYLTVRKPPHLIPHARYFAQEHRNIVIGVRLEVAACARAEQYDTLEPFTVILAASSQKRRNVGSCVACLPIMRWLRYESDDGQSGTEPQRL